MDFTQSYFITAGDAPAPLRAVAEGRVRFQEVDAMGIVWHGHYASFFEKGRIAFGDRYGMSYQEFRRQRTPAPVVRFHCDYKRPLLFDENYTVETSLHWNDAARLDFSYAIRNSGSDICATGYTVQLLTDKNGEICLLLPDWLASFRRYWRNGCWQQGPWRAAEDKA